ncbi:MAG: hypothetical protein SFV81_04985 [Pirellulaceae bacterium]|nr:hypothetical protein [Pirellulaceae bacterium]
MFCNSQFFPNVDATARINFLTPVIAFGGYWGGETGQWAPDPAPLEVRIYDVSNNLIGSDNFFYTRSLRSMVYFNGMAGNGWQSTVAIGAIEYTGTLDFHLAELVLHPTLILGLGVIGWHALSLRRAWL